MVMTVKFWTGFYAIIEYMPLAVFGFGSRSNHSNFLLAPLLCLPSNSHIRALAHRNYNFYFETSKNLQLLFSSQIGSFS